MHTILSNRYTKLPRYGSPMYIRNVRTHRRCDERRTLPSPQKRRHSLPPPLPPIEWLAGAIGEEERRKKAGSVPPAGDLHSC